MKKCIVRDGAHKLLERKQITYLKKLDIESLKIKLNLKINKGYKNN